MQGYNDGGGISSSTKVKEGTYNDEVIEISCEETVQDYKSYFCEREEVYAKQIQRGGWRELDECTNIP